MPKKLLKDSMSLTKTSLLLGVGSTAVAKVGGNTSGLSTLSSYTPMMATAVGAKHTLKLVKKLK